jgi:hypothetical protein
MKENNMNKDNIKNPFTIRTETQVFWGTFDDMYKAKLRPKRQHIFHVNNISLKNESPNNNNKLEISDPIIALTIKNGLWGYFHFIRDILAEIEIIKNHYPKAKIKIFQLCEDGNFNWFFSVLKKREIFESYEITDKDIIRIDSYSEIVIKKLLFIYNDQNYLTNSIVEVYQPYDFDLSSDEDTWSIEYKESIQERFLKNPTLHGKRKIFISRAHDDKRLRKDSETLYKAFHGYPLSLENLELFNQIPASKYAEYADRPLTLINEKKIEKFFEQAGYEIIDPGESFETLQEQAELYNSASHIVSLPGAGLVNCCFANPNVKVLILNNTDSYEFPHREIVRSLGIFCVESPKRVVHGHKIYSAEEIFDSVKKNYPEFLV